MGFEPLTHHQTQPHLHSRAFLLLLIEHPKHRNCPFLLSLSTIGHPNVVDPLLHSPLLIVTNFCFVIQNSTRLEMDFETMANFNKLWISSMAHRIPNIIATQTFYK